MADEQGELRRVNWNELFGFTHIFKGFRLAIHPSKMALVLAAIVIILVSGWVVDWFWGAAGQYARENEIDNYAVRSRENFNDWKDKWQEGRLEQAAGVLAEAEEQKHTLKKYMARAGYTSKYLAEAMDEELAEYNQEYEPEYRPPNVSQLLADARRLDTGYGELLADAQDTFQREVDKIRDILDDARAEAAEAIRKDEALGTEEDRRQAEEQLNKHYAAARRALSERKLEFAQSVTAVRGRPVFASFVEHEWNCLRKGISAAVSGRLVSGLGKYQEILRSKAIQPIADYEPFRPAGGDESPGLFFWMLLAYQGIVWLFAEHSVLAVVMIVEALAVWALLGGAVCRIAALHACRDEKISIRQALRFSAGKFLSFFSAPLIPLAIIFTIGLMVSIGGLVLNIPVVGPIVVGALFFLAVLAGLAIAFLLIGLLGGASLMYPTIAVEGSDSFDAISRSFSYVYARPFRTLLYGLVALIYGIITYLFVRLFVYLALSTVHFFLKWFVWTGGEGLSSEADKVDVLWTAPQFQSLFGPFSWSAMSGPEKIGAFLIGAWVFLAAASVAAYLISFFSSASTCIYLLLRRKVDATDLDGVYVEEAPEEFEQPGPETPEGETPEQKEPPAEQPPESEKPGEEEGPSEGEGEEKSEGQGEGEQT